MFLPPKAGSLAAEQPGFFPPKGALLLPPKMGVLSGHSARRTASVVVRLGVRADGQQPTNG